MEAKRCKRCNMKVKALLDEHEVPYQRSFLKLIVNPMAAGGKVGRQWPRVRRILKEESVEFDAGLTEGVGHATELVCQALEAGYRTIVALGGDGTVNEVINGLMADGAADPEVVLGIIPAGIGADLARTLGIPSNYMAACRRLLKGETHLIDLGKITYIYQGREAQRYFANVAGLGFDGEVVRRVTSGPRILSSSTIRYLGGLLTTLTTYENGDVSVTFDEKELRQRAFSAVICNGRYFGGGMCIAPGALLDDGLFDVIIIGDCTKLEVVANLFRVYRGTHLSHPKVDVYQARKVRVEAQERMLLQADGELLGETPAVFQIIPQALRVLV